MAEEGVHKVKAIELLQTTILFSCFLAKPMSPVLFSLLSFLMVLTCSKRKLSKKKKTLFHFFPCEDFVCIPSTYSRTRFWNYLC